MAISKRNIFLTNTAEAMPYASDPKRVSTKYPKRDVKAHAERIQKKLQEAYNAANEQKQAAAIRFKEGVYLEFSSAEKYDLAFERLENRQQGIRLLNVKKDPISETVKAIVFIPEGKETYFINKVEAYATEKTPRGNPKNNDLIRSIEDVKLAMVDSFWLGDKKDIPVSNPVWCEVWLRFDYDKNNPDSWNIQKLILLKFADSTK